MKRVIYIILLSVVLLLSANSPVNAGYFADRKVAAQQAKYEKNCRKEIAAVFDKVDKYAKKYDIKGLKSLYSKSFIDNDGYNKDVYFSLVEETWQTYPDITYTTKIKDIKLNGDYATVETEETAVATSDDLDRKIIGELNSKSNCIYQLQRFANNWEITGESVLEEFSTLKYGDARYVNMVLESPKSIGAGQEYTATLKVDLPSNYVVVSSINQEKIVNPAQKPEENFMKLKEDQTLARIFTANTDNVNEYNVASIGITALENAPNGKVRVYMNGLAFVMSRVNVIPKNNYARVDKKPEGEKNEQQTK